MAGKIKKLLENELVGGTQTTDVYPVTSTKDVYDENNERLDNIINKIEPGIIYDVSANNDGAVFESLQALLSSSNLSTLIPPSVRHGGMSIKFIQGSEQSSDNKYVQFRYTGKDVTGNPNPFLNTDNWQKQGAEVAELFSVPEYLRLIVGSDNKAIFWIKSDGTIGWAEGVPDCLKTYIATQLNLYVAKETGKSIINSDLSDITSSYNTESAAMWPKTGSY